MKKIMLYAFALMSVLLILLCADSVIQYSREAMQLCYEIIIPTLFPFFVCSGLLIYSGFGSVMARAAQKIMRPLFNVAPSGAAAFSIGLISGFPLGAATTSQLYGCGALSKSEAERLLSFCNNSGPLFIIGSVGAAIYGKTSYGVILYIIHIISSVAVGIIFRGYAKTKHTSPPRRLDTFDLSIPDIFGTALSNASKNIITVCFSIIFFSSLSRALLDITPLPDTLNALASGLCEFSTGTLKVSMLDISVYEKLILTSFIVGFSGISVHLQVMATTSKSGLSLKPYVIGKLLHGTIAAAITAALLYFFPRSLSVFSYSYTNVMSKSFAVIPMLILASLATALCLRFLARRIS